eukprot:COSAG06_NODE_30425_length_539_cov_0.688636_1_plen_88_part_00
MEFVPFSIEAGGVWGPAAKRFFETCLKLADGDRDVDLYHWSSGQFSSTWYDTMSILVAKGRAKVGVARQRVCGGLVQTHSGHAVCRL